MRAPTEKVLILTSPFDFSSSTPSYSMLQIVLYFSVVELAHMAANRPYYH